MADVLTVISGSGGMGKSFFACNISCCLESFGKRVLLVEATFGSRSDDVILGIKPDTLYTVGDIVDGTCRVSNAITVSCSDSLPDFIPASHRLAAGSTSDGFEKIVSYAKDRYDYVIFDTSSSGSQEAYAALKLSNAVFVLTDCSFLSLRNASLCTARARDLGSDSVYTVINLTTAHDDADVFAEDVIDEAGAPLIGIIPYDEHVRASLLTGDVIYKYNTFSGRALENICRRILGESVPGYETGAKNSFFSRNKLVLK